MNPIELTKEKESQQPTREKQHNQRYRRGTRLDGYPLGFYTDDCRSYGEGGERKKKKGRRGEEKGVFIVVGKYVCVDVFHSLHFTSSYALGNEG